MIFQPARDGPLAACVRACVTRGRQRTRLACLRRSNATGERLAETQSINKSLSALGDVFQALGRRPGAPYLLYYSA